MIPDEIPNGTPLTQVLETGKADLVDVLVYCGISCENCQHNTDEAKGIEPFACNTFNVFVNTPRMSVCMYWRQRKGGK